MLQSHGKAEYVDDLLVYSVFLVYASCIFLFWLKNSQNFWNTNLFIYSNSCNACLNIYFQFCISYFIFLDYDH